MQHIASASQFKDFSRCQRLWWWKKVRHLPGGPPSYGMTFGNVLHSCLERWLEADDQGRDADGIPAEIFPEGWQTYEGERITPEDEELIPKLLDMAIEEGMLDRLPGREIEENFLGILVDSNDGAPFSRRCYVTGKIDVSLPDRIVDHKGTKSMRYALSKAKLASDIQMLLYAKVKEVTTLQHNVFDRTEGRIRKTVVEVEQADVEANWQLCQAWGEQMLQLKEAKHPDSDWPAVPGPVDGVGEVCAMYGGCSFLSICSNYETPKKFRRRHLRLNNPEPPRSYVSNEKKLTLDEKIAAAKAKQAGNAPVNPPKVEVPDDPKAEEPWGDEPPGSVEQVEAWAGRLAADSVAAGEIETFPAPNQRATDVQETSDVQETGYSVTALRKMKKPALIELVQEMQRRAPEEPAQKGGLTILHSCHPVRGGGKVVPLFEVFRYAVEDVGGDKVETYYKKDTWKRRDVLRSTAGQVAEELGTVTISVPSHVGPDERELLSALLPFATNEIVALA